MTAHSDRVRGIIDACPLEHFTANHRDLLTRAVDTAQDRDRWRALALELKRCDETGDDPVDGFLWRIWQDAARRANERAELLGTRLALAERALRTGDRGHKRAWRDHVRDHPIDTGDTEP